MWFTASDPMARSSSRLLAEPVSEPIRSYFSQMSVLYTAIAAGGVSAPAGPGRSPAWYMGMRDAFHVVVAHLAASATLREAADRCANFGQGVAERASVHPYGPEWCDGFAEAALGAAADIALYAAGEVVPPIDAEALRAARTTARYLSPLHALRAIRPEGSADSRGW